VYIKHMKTYYNDEERSITERGGSLIIKEFPRKGWMNRMEAKILKKEGDLFQGKFSVKLNHREIVLLKFEQGEFSFKHKILPIVW